jgi:hypothetical protein
MAILGSLISVTVTIFLFFGFLFGIYHLLRWLLARLPDILVSVQPQHLDKTLGLLLSLAFFPDLISFAWNVVVTSVNYIPVVIHAISTSPIPNSVSDFSANLGKSVDLASTWFVNTLNLSQFPAAEFVRFLLIAVVVTQVIGAIYQPTIGDKIRSLYGVASQLVTSIYGVASVLVPATFWRWLAFPVLVLVSFYLGLSALLAIAVYQDKSRSELTVEALDKALEAIKPELLDQRFFFALPKPTPLNMTESNANGNATRLAKKFERDIQSREQILGELQNAWNNLRATAMDSAAEWHKQAIKAFADGLKGTAGKKQTAQYYNNLVACIKGCCNPRMRDCPNAGALLTRSSLHPRLLTACRRRSCRRR